MPRATSAGGRRLRRTDLDWIEAGMTSQSGRALPEHVEPLSKQNAGIRCAERCSAVGRGVLSRSQAFNRHIWARLESFARHWVRDPERGYVLTGPLFWDPDEEAPETADGFIAYETIGDNAVAVPTHFFKIIVVPEGEGWRAIAFVLENWMPRDVARAVTVRNHSWPTALGGRRRHPESRP